MASKNKEKKQRVKDRRRQLLELGKQATEVVTLAERCAAEADNARKSLGQVTAELSECRKHAAERELVLDGLRLELAAAGGEVEELCSERDKLTDHLTVARSELEIAKAVDSDARSLRARLSSKSEEIERLKRVIGDLRARISKLSPGISFDASSKS